jgi:hypothetical protein
MDLQLSFTLPNEGTKGKAKYKQIYDAPVLTLHPKVGKLNKLQRKCIINDAGLSLMGITGKTDIGVASVGADVVLLNVSTLPVEQQYAVKHKATTVSGSFGGTALYNKILKAIGIDYKEKDGVKFNFSIEPMDISDVVVYKLTLLSEEPCEQVDKSTDAVRELI